MKREAVATVRFALLGALVLAGGLAWAARGRRSAADPGSPAPVQSRVVAEKESLLAVDTLFEQQSSAYQARLFADEQGTVLVTQPGFVLFRGGEVAEEHTTPLGPVAVRQGGSVVFWRSGWLRQISLGGGNESQLAALARPPRYLLASEQRLAWIDQDRESRASLQTLSGREVRVVYESEDTVRAAVLRDALVYWILQSRDGSWKVGSIGLDGQRRRLTAAYRGRPPALLALGPDGLYFYDGPERGVRRLSFELDREYAVSTNVICSPLVISSRAICAQVGGLFDVPPGGMGPRFLASERDGPITALAATDERVFWVAERGNERLVVRSAPLPAL